MMMMIMCVCDSFENRHANAVEHFENIHYQRNTMLALTYAFTVAWSAAEGQERGLEIKT